MLCDGWPQGCCRAERHGQAGKLSLPRRDSGVARAMSSMSMGHGVMLQHRDVLHTFYVTHASSVKQKVRHGKQVACSMYAAIVYSCACCRTFHLPSTEFVVRFFMAFCMSVSSLPGCIQCGSYHVSACQFSQSRFRSFVYEVFATTMC